MEFKDKYVKYCPVCSETGQNVDYYKDEKMKECDKGFFAASDPRDDLKICPHCHRGGWLTHL